MDDMRTALLQGTELVFGNNQKVIIENVVGRGASCLVYNAEYCDSAGYLHNVRIKECYPYFIFFNRECKGNLILSDKDKPDFERAKRRFRQAYEKNAAIKRIAGLVNSTGTVSEIFEANGTVYSVLSYEEGTDYRRYEDKTLKELLEHIRAVAAVLQKYHERGYLHLDIKPENIFVFPETAQYIQLFDFDSIIKIDELKSGSISDLSVSDGFAPPEQLQGRFDRISPATDVYALGAVLFYKLFGRTPVSNECNLGAKYDFSLMKYKDGRYQARLFKELTRLFQKSIAASVIVRWQSMDEFIEQLDILLPLADTKQVFVCDNFSYHSKCFVGRSEKISEMQRMLTENQVAFLSGIGGIGKTELAKRYAYLMREEYDKVIFVPFLESIDETISGRDIIINNEVQDGDGTESLFETRLRVLKATLTDKDLFILDNFDVDMDDNLERLLECKCKFIITSRCDFSDFNYPQIRVDCLESEAEVLELFATYNEKEYPGEEWQSISGIVELVDSHTMTVELIAKYLRDSDELPSGLLSGMMEKEGVTSIKELGVRHRKDRHLRAESVNRHLLFLFNLSGFSDREAELMRSLSLLGYVRILKSSFLKYCNMEHNEKALEALIKKGWIEYSDETEKVSLHQIILDLVYNYMNPVAENCPGIVRGMRDLFLAPIENYVERENRRKLFESFIKRLKGNCIEYAELCVLYRRNTYLSVAEKICRESNEALAKDLLYQIYSRKMNDIGECDDMFEMFEKDMSEEEYYQNKADELLRAADAAVGFAREYSMEAAYQAIILMETGNRLDDVLGNISFMMAEDYNEGALRSLYDKVVELYREAEPYILESELENEQKKNLLEKIREFYGSEDYFKLYRFEHYADADKAYHYQQLIDSFDEKQDDEISKITLSMTFTELAEAAYRKKEYEKAIRYYESAIDESGYSYILPQMANVRMAQRKSACAAECLERLLEEDKARIEAGYRYASYTGDACYRLIGLLGSLRRTDKARQYAEELAAYKLREFEDEHDIEAVNWVLAGYYKLYALEADEKNKALLWERCLEYFDMLEENVKFVSELTEFLIEYSDKKDSDREKIRTAFGLFERSELEYDRMSKIMFLNYMADVCRRNKELVSEYINVLLLLGESMLDYPQKPGKSLQYCKEARALWEEYFPENEYIKGRIYHGLAESYYARKKYNYDNVKELKRQCNYYYMAKVDEVNKSVQERIKIWEDAADKYNYIDEYSMGVKCLEEAAYLFSEKEFKEYDEFEEYSKLMLSLVRGYAKLRADRELTNAIIRLYNKMLSFCYECDNETDTYSGCEIVFRNIGEIAWICELEEYAWEAILFYTVKIYVELSKTVDREVLKAVADSMNGIEQLLMDSFREVLKGDVSSEKVDSVIGIYDRIKPFFDKVNNAGKVQEALESFAKRYQKWEFEFKREE